MINIPGLIAKYQGQSLSYDGIEANRGQCVQWVEYVLTDNQVGYGLAPFWGNAIDWWNGFSGVLAANFDRIPYPNNGYPKAGDIVIWGAGVGSVYGHIDLCVADGDASGFQGYDSNWNGKTVHAVAHNYNAVIGYLRPKGSVVDDMVSPSEADVYSGFRQFANKEPASPDQVQYYMARDIRELYHDLMFYEIIPKLEEVQQAFKTFQPDLPIDTPPFTDQSTYYQQHTKGVLYNDLATGLLKKANVLANKADTSDKQVVALTSENTTLRQELTAADNQIKDPNKIIITNKGWSALWTAIQSFFVKNN